LNVSWDEALTVAAKISNSLEESHLSIIPSSSSVIIIADFLSRSMHDVDAIFAMQLYAP